MKPTSLLLVLVVAAAAVLASPAPGFLNPLFHTYPVGHVPDRYGIKKYYPTWLQVSPHYVPRIKINPLDSIHIADIAYGGYDGYGVLKPYGGYGKPKSHGHHGGHYGYGKK
ncbi:uncharacterized protein LOC126993221 [Eriocheir sinensis]|uniref:uncharacterized protein LOC126993221 n=1 Tax=Eriocheir sinensis TaxID=95602 RepID=UPI0021C57451|nr:uncharacterized protein LOC126993221 [Eriocheir sinensis]